MTVVSGVINEQGTHHIPLMRAQKPTDMSYSLNSLKGHYIGGNMGTTIKLLRGILGV